MKRAVILFAEGYETVEALLVVDLLRRGGVEVTMASITEDEFVRSSHGVNVEMDAVLGEVDVLDYDAIILPGGMPGTINLGESDAVRKAILAMNDAGKIVAAVCAAPGVLGKYGLLEGKTACSFPQHEKNLIGATVVREPVVVDGNIVTSRGLGTTMDFGLKLLELLEGKEKSDEIAHKTVYREKYRSQKLALVQKVPTPIKPITIDQTTRHITLAYFEQKSTVDYIGVVQGIPICFDAKECATDRFPLANVHEHQIRFMKEFEEQDGIAYLLIYFKAKDTFMYLPYAKLDEFWRRMEEGGAKHFKYEELDPAYEISTYSGTFVHYLEQIQMDLEQRDSR